MFELPRSTEIRKPLHKKLIYQKYAAELSKEKRDKFDADISRMIITNEISEASVNVRATEKTSAIFVVQIELKTKEYNEKNIIMISKLFKQHLLLVLHYGDKYQLAIYETALLKSEWSSENNIALKLNGLDLDTIWDNLVTQVSGIEVSDGNTIVEQITIENAKGKIIEKIAGLERQARKEQQSKKKFSIFQEIKECQKELEELENGKDENANT